VDPADVPECAGLELAPPPSRCIAPEVADRAERCLHAMTRRSFELALGLRELSRARAEERAYEPAAGRGRSAGQLFDHAGDDGEATLLALGYGTAPPRELAVRDSSGTLRSVSLAAVSALARDAAGRLHPVELAPTLVRQLTYLVCDCPSEPESTEPRPPQQFWAYELPTGAPIREPVRVPFELHTADLRPSIVDPAACQ
jgi:hypothetical protein